MYVRSGVPQGSISIVSLDLFDRLVSNCPVNDFDMIYCAYNFTLLASAPCIVEDEARANQLTTTLVWCADRKQLVIAPQKSSVTLFTSDSQQYWLHPQVRVCDEVAPLNRIPKCLGVMLDTHFIFGFLACDCIQRASRALNVTKAYAGIAGIFRPILRWRHTRPPSMLPHLVHSSVLLTFWTNFR